jgi:uncharacterized protein YkwD
VPTCDHCGTEVMLPFTCAYCGGNYCVEHRLPENHHCSHLPKVPPPYLTTYNNTEPSQTPRITKKPTRTEPSLKRRQFSPKKLVVFSIIAILACVLVWSAYPNLLQSTQSPPASPSPSTTPSAPSTTPPNTLPETISHEELVNYALSLINSDRQSQGLQNVTLSSVDSGQRHADDMLTNHFFSHWDTNGYKPYMRYTLANGKGSVSENGAWYYISEGLDPFKALKKLEYDMMYDDASSNWGHRDNILNAFHNKISIGIAYDRDNLYFVQDFEDDYVSWLTLSLSHQVLMQGTILKAGESISQVAIYFDNPMPLTTQQLGNPPYDNGYDAGTYVGMVVSPPPSGSEYQQPKEGILIIANGWSETGQDFNINFDLSTAFARCGKGVYTLYLWTDSNNYLTTLSIWN